MANRTVLAQEDQQFLDALIKDEVNGDSSIQVTAVGPRLTMRLREMAEHGEAQAARIIEGLATDAGNERTKVYLKNRDRTTFRVTASGAVLSVPSRVGHRARKASGEESDFFQQSLWYELTWAEFKAWLRDRIQQRDSLSAVITAFETILALHDRFPATRTPLEACELAGIDPRLIDIDEAVA